MNLHTPTTEAALAPDRGAVGRERDLRLDFFRGLSLFFIFIDHIPGNLLAYATFRTLAFSDAAEVFIFISGFTAALVYGSSLTQHGALLAAAEVYRRVWQLYVAHIFLFVIFVAEVSYSVMVVHNPMYIEEMRVANFLEAPHLAVIRTLLLTFQPAFFDILPLYIVLLAAFPLVLFGLRLHRLLPFVASALLYGLTLWRGWAPHTYPAGAPWFFNPLAWQFLFVIGATAGYSRVSGVWPFPAGKWFRVLAIVVAGLCALISLDWTIHWLYDPFPPLLAKQLWTHTLDKTDLAPLRLVDFLAIATTIVVFVRPESGFLRMAWARPLIVCGQHSLYVFCLGIVLAVLGHFILAEFYNGVVIQAAVNLAGFAAMIGLAYLLEWYKTASRRMRGARAPAATSLE
ncbi:MAG: OpgC domain-containing protein [Alphaproteobacteria bacterium]|nr:OpgC domain-containing protein [Alphaproteobacteria bacterium]